MKYYLSIVLAGATFIVGLWVTYCWYKACTVPIDPPWEVEPGDAQLPQMGWTAATIQACTKSARLNKVAAGWTALAVFLGTILNFVGLLR